MLLFGVSRKKVMRAITGISMLLTGFLLVSGCTPEETSSQPSQLLLQDKTETAKANAEVKSEQARLANQKYAFARRAEFINGLELEFQSIQEDFNKVVVSVEGASETRKSELKASITKMQSQLDAAKEDIKEARNATEDNWDEVQSDIRSSWNSLHDSLDQSREWLSEKVSP